MDSTFLFKNVVLTLSENEISIRLVFKLKSDLQLNAICPVASLSLVGEIHSGKSIRTIIFKWINRLHS